MRDSDPRAKSFPRSNLQENRAPRERPVLATTRWLRLRVVWVASAPTTVRKGRTRQSMAGNTRRRASRSHVLARRLHDEVGRAIVGIHVIQAAERARRVGMSRRGGVVRTSGSARHRCARPAWRAGRTLDLTREGDARSQTHHADRTHGDQEQSCPVQCLPPLVEGSLQNGKPRTEGANPRTLVAESLHPVRLGAQGAPKHTIRFEGSR